MQSQLQLGADMMWVEEVFQTRQPIFIIFNAAPRSNLEPKMPLLRGSSKTASRARWASFPVSLAAGLMSRAPSASSSLMFLPGAA